MSIEALDWDTVSLKLENSSNDLQINQTNLKESSIFAAIEMKDYKILQYLSKTKSGIINDKLRCEVWPILLGVDLLESTSVVTDWRSLPPHKDEDQVGLDVERSFVYYPQNISGREKAVLRSKLKDVVIRILRTNPELSYYQGYHDICTVFVIIFQNDLEMLFRVVNTFTLCHLRDFMMPNIDSTIQMLRLIPELTFKVDRSLHEEALMDNLEPFYCLSPLITLFSHDVVNFSTICQVFDFIIASGSISAVLYLYTSLLSIKKDQIFEKISMVEDSDCFSKHDLIHDSLSKFLKSISAEDVDIGIKHSLKYVNKFPLSSLKTFKKINQYSVLKTSPPINEINQDVLLDRIQLSDSALLSKQIEAVKRITTTSKGNKGLFSFKNMLSSKRNQHLFTVSITIGILSLLLNIILNKAGNTQLINHFLHMWNHNDNILNVGIRPFKDFFTRIL